MADEGRWPCKVKGCEGNVEANPTLYLSLNADGTWEVTGVADEAANVTCDNVEHDQMSEILEKSMSAFLEETFPGMTWQGSAPDRFRDYNDG